MFSVIAEYCINEIFSPKCGSQEVIIMKHALYGRMQRGKCVSNSMGLGCETNVLHILDEKCSNKHQCQLTIALEFHSVETQCPPDMFRYLDADYSCEQGKRFYKKKYFRIRN